MQIVLDGSKRGKRRRLNNRVAKRLTVFMGRKSLKQRDREELDWYYDIDDE